MAQSDHDEMEFSAAAEAKPGDPAVPWLVMVVDDDAEVQAVTRLALSAFQFDGRPLRIVSANSGAQARELLPQHPEVALILLDVVMETEHAGLDLVRYIRDELKNTAVRIILRTGQPGEAPPQEIAARYEIDDFRSKIEMTFERLNILVLTALRTFRLVQRLEQRQAALARSNQELERFAYIASHDLQAPLRSIVGFTQILQRRHVSKLDAEANELMNFVVQAALDLQALITGLLQLSRIGHGSSHFAPVDLNQLVAAACRTLRPVLDERGAIIDCAPLPTIDGNAAQLDQLLRNLIENAIKFQPGAQPYVGIAATAVGTDWEIRVSDRGIGIEAQFLAQVFEVFRRLHTADQFPGTGIGLAICMKVAQFHGGHIHAESTPGHGTTIVIRLPAKQTPL